MSDEPKSYWSTHNARWCPRTDQWIEYEIDEKGRPLTPQPWFSDYLWEVFVKPFKKKKK